MSEEEQAEHDKEYKALLAIFLNFLKNINSDNRDEILLSLMDLRAELAIHHAFKGFDIDVDEALMFLKNKNDDNLTKEDKDKRDRIIAAVNNLIEFAVCEEYQVAQKTIEVYQSNKGNDEDYGIDFNDQEDIEEYEEICALYNDTYAAVENADIEYAMLVANKWIHMGGNELLTYWTMNDNKVRPWHLALQGYTARQDDFPSWMIPPIEWNCRCFLISASEGETLAKNIDVNKIYSKAPIKPKQLDGVFSESVAKCGRIFSKSHSYFSVKKNDVQFLKDCVSTIKLKYYG